MRLETERLIFREFVYDDWMDVFAYQSDPLYMRYYDFPYRTQVDSQVMVRMFIEWQKEQPRRKFQWALLLKPGNELIGNCGIRIDDPLQRQANIGYEIDSRYWNQGLATEAAHVVVAFGFERLHLQRVWAWCIAENVASARVLEKAGMHLESREREKERIRGVWHDTLTYAIPQEEWQRMRADRLITDNIYKIDE